MSIRYTRRLSACPDPPRGSVRQNLDFSFCRGLVDADPELTIGIGLGRLFAAPRPDTPTLTFVGTDEQIVSIDAIHRLSRDWPSSEVRVVDGARHEMMMEAPSIRQRFMSETLEAFSEA